MNRTSDTCLKNLAVMAAPEVFAILQKLETKIDPRRTSSEVPDLRTAAQQHKFCEVYDNVVRHYQILSTVGHNDMTNRARHMSVNWLSRMFATEPLVNKDNSSIMIDFYFLEEQFATDHKPTRDHYLALVAHNMPYLVLAALNQKKLSMGMCQQPIPVGVGQDNVPQLLMMGVYHHPSPSFTQGYLEKTIRFSCTIAELYSDQKMTGKRYSAAIQACRAKKEATISLESPKLFELAVSMTMDILQDQAIQQQEALVCFIMFELLPNYAKRALKDL